MVLAKKQTIYEGLDAVPQAEPIRLPRRGRPWTAADLLTLTDREHRYELIRGDLLMMSPASPVQGRYAARLAHVLYDYVDEHGLGEVYTAEPGFILQSEPEETVRVPDVAFVSTDRIPPPAEESGFWSLAPDIAIEIISPSETANAVQDKVQDYLMAGVRLIWLVYPATKTVVEYQSATRIRQLSTDDSLTGGEVIPGFQYPLKDLFRERR